MADLTLTATATSGGVATITVRPTYPETWDIGQVSVEHATAGVGAACALRKNGYLVAPLIPTGDAAEGYPLTLLPSDVVTIVWTGVPTGSVAKAYVAYRSDREGG